MNKLSSYSLKLKGFIKRILKKIRKDLEDLISISLLESERKDFIKEQMSMDIQNSKNQAERGTFI